VVEVETVAGLDLGVFLFHREVELVITGCGVGLIGRVAEDVLAAEFLIEAGVDFVESFFFRDFEKSAAGDFGELFENFLSVGA